MKKRIGLSLLAALTAVGLLSASPAAAATEFGDNCVGNESIESPITLFEISSSLNPLPPAAPVSGVITQWKSNLIPVPVTVPVTLTLLRQTSPTTVQTVGEASGTITGGLNTFPTRLPVSAGDRLGFFGPSEFGPIVCDEEVGTSVIGAYEGSTPVGGSATFVTVPTTGVRVPLFASIEPDADGDGFGDETQDACPQSATTQAACPVVKLSVSTSVKKKRVTVIVTGSSAATVTVNSRVSLGKGGTVRIKAGPKAVNPGAFSKFALKFPQKLINRLQELPANKRLTLKITSSAPNLAAGPTKKVIRVKLKGQG